MSLKSVSDSEVIEIIGHRGAPKVAPENTLSSFLRAIELGVTQVEFDVCLTKDGVPVIFHDDSIDRCSNGTGLLSDFTLKELEAFDFGSWFHNDFKGESLLTLETLLQLLFDQNIRAQLELKLHKNVSAKNLVNNTLNVVSNMKFYSDQLTFSSFSHDALRHVVSAGLKYPVAALFEGPEKNWKDWVRECHAGFIHFDSSQVTKDFLNELRGSGCGLRSYTVNDMKSAQYLYNNGVRGFFTDDPDCLDIGSLVDSYEPG